MIHQYLKKLMLAGMLGISMVAAPAAETLKKSGSTQVSHFTEAEKAFFQFPDTIQGAIKIEKYPVQGAKHCLVHVRAIHDGWYGHGRFSTNSVEYPFVLQAQQGMYQILTNLITRFKIDAIYSEGNTSDDFARDAIANERKLIVDIEKKDLEEYALHRYKTAVIGRVILTKDVHIKATEDPDALDKGREVTLKKNATLGEFAEYALERREDGVLERIAESAGPLAVLVYGGGHLFGGKSTCGDGYRREMVTSKDPQERIAYKVNKDNIAEWNAAHPMQKFSFIDITPKGYEKYESFIKNQ